MAEGGEEEDVSFLRTVRQIKLNSITVNVMIFVMQIAPHISENQNQGGKSFQFQEDMVCLSCTDIGERVCLSAEGFGNRSCFLESIADRVIN